MLKLKIKMVDIARYLGISKATVSLAVNGKPGVNEETRKKVLDCLEEMKRNGGKLPEAQPEPVQVQKTVNQMIKVVVLNHRKKVVCDPELDLWTEVISTFDSEAKRLGYLYSLSYINDNGIEAESIIDECNMDIVVGVILFGTELMPEDSYLINQINKPVVLYDAELPEGRYSSVCIDNYGAVKTAMRLLRNSGAKTVKYLCTGKEIYNFKRRKEAFLSEIDDKCSVETDEIIVLGKTIAEITQNMIKWIESHKLPDAFLFENYQTSLGVMAALRSCGIKVPRDIKIVGIDEIPTYTMADMKLTQIKVPHAERAVMAMDILDKEIKNILKSKMTVYAEPEVILQESL